MIIKFTSSLNDFNINMIITYKKVEDETKRLIKEDNITIIDRIPIEEFKRIKQIYNICLLNSTIILDKCNNINTDKDKEYSLKCILSNNYQYIIINNQKDVFCNTIFINQYNPIIDQQRRRCLEDITNTYSLLILGIINKDKYINKYTYNDVYNTLTNEESNNLFITSVINEIDKYVFYRLYSVYDELANEEKIKIRKRIIINEDILKECFGLVNFLISS